MTALEALSTQQAQLGKEIEKLAKSFFTEAAERKTLAYLKEKQASLSKLWQAFEAQDQLILKNYAEHTHHQYFTSTYFKKVQLVYDEVYAEVTALLQVHENSLAASQLTDQTASTSKTHHEVSLPASTLTRDPTASTSKIQEEDKLDLQKLKRERERLIKIFTTMIDNLDTVAGIQSAQYYKLKAQTVSQYWSELEKVTKAIWESSNEVTEGFEIQEFIHLQEKYHGAIISLTDKQEQTGCQTNEMVVSEVGAMMRLPKIELPKFNGDYLKWQQFSDLFVQMVHSKPISNVQKMFYLKANLEGEAERLIPVSNGNYPSAWEVLVNRYANKRLLVNALLERLINIPTMSVETASSIKKLHDITRECILGLETQGLMVYKHWDPILLYLLIKKLDKNTHTTYEQSLAQPRELQSLREFLDFLELRFQALEALGPRTATPDRKSASVHAATKRTACPYCNKDHVIYYCENFIRLPTQGKQAAVKKLNLCFNCLRPGHQMSQCSSGGCRKCQQKHNTLLHKSELKDQQGDAKGSSVTTHLGANSSTENTSYVFLGTATAFILNGAGERVKCRVLVDSGSQVSFITESLNQRLKLANMQDHLDVTGIGQTKMKANQKVYVTLLSRTTSSNLNVELHVIKNITSYQPQQYIHTQDWNIPTNIALADPEFNKPSKVDILLGAELYGELMRNGQIRLGENLPVLQNTSLGWVVLGKMSRPTPFCGITNVELDQRIQQFWELEDCTTEKLISQADQKCEAWFQATTIRNPSGRYTVNLPMFTEASLLGNSQNMAYRRFINIEKKLQRQPELYQQYKDFLEEYLRLGHMQEIEATDLPAVHYFLPHHFVLKPSSTTTKLRVVFDASAKTTSNISLNDLMVAGPRIQDDLFDIMLRFRMHKYVFTADIAQMYRQILMNPEDQNLQLIMWRKNPADKLKYFKLCTVTYGTRAAPYLATRCLKQLAEDETTNYPVGASKIQDFYMDDIITGADSLTEIRKIRTELDKLMTKGGFKLRKWCANHPAILERVPASEIELQIDFTKHNTECIKTLGLAWEPLRDCFKYSIEWPMRTITSKRTVLADISQLFDPLGLVNPVIVIGKIFMQHLWSLSLDWDDELPEDLQTSWLDFRANLRFLNELNIGRHVIIPESPATIELHAFADASERAYGTAVYMRSTDSNGNILVKLLCAKSRVAPRKIITIPRLELCAAKLATQLVQCVTKNIAASVTNVTYWSDSTIVLSWIHGDPATLKTFNANRVQRIQEVSSPSQWKYIKTTLNPADLVSRGATPQQLTASALWFCGPSFLKTPMSEWPDLKFEAIRDVTEEKNTRATLNCSNNDLPDNFLTKIRHENSFWKLQRIVAYLLRSINIMKKRYSKDVASGHLQVKELNEALDVIVRWIQGDKFQEEIKDLRTKGVVKNSSRLATLTPFLDNRGLLRVGGRLEAAAISYSAKHPLLLPGDHILSKLLLNDLHVRHLHAGPQALMAIVRQQFWVIQARAIIHTVVNNCVHCARAKPHLMQQLMGNLPASRVLPGRPFVTTGVDFCGPIWTHYRLRGKRPHKSYVAVFCCFVTKAVHLEVVSDLTSEAFLGALKRFVARRGLCKDIYCDNATNFVGAKNKLEEVYAMLNKQPEKEKILNECAKDKIQFHFSPPRSPHFGGLWEAAVKSFKELLYKTVAPASLTFEELTTVTAEIEAILNSRPLTPMSSNPNDLTALTPGHFLIGEPLVAVPESSETAKMSSLSRWKLVTSLTNEFWRRWKTEYLAELQQKVKWTKGSPNVKIGEMVIIKNENLPPLNWPLGRIVKLHPGQDDKVRVVEVRTATGTFTRAVHNLSRLPIEEEYTTPTSADESTTSKKRQDDPEDKPSKRRCTARGALTSLLLLCLMLPSSTIATHSDQFITVEPFSNQAGIYFENLGHAQLTSHDWKWVIYYNMTSYWTMLRTIEKGVNKLEILERLSQKQSYLAGIVAQHQHMLQGIHDVNNILLSHHGIRQRKRPKRGLINGVGMVARKLFGVLDEDYAAEVKDTIDKVQANENHLLGLLKNQTSVIEATASVFKKTEEERLKQSKAIQRMFEEHMIQIANLNHELKEQAITQTFLALSAFTSLISSEYQQIQTALLETITDVHHGKLNPRIISGEKLVKELTAIKEHLPSALCVPTSDIAAIYRLMTVKCDINRDYTMFVVTVPLASLQEFEIFKLVPFPILVNETFIAIKPGSELLLVNLQRDAFYQLTILEFAHCMELHPDNFLCPQNHPVYNQNADIIQCEAQIMNRQQLSDKCSLEITTPSRTWIKLSHPNQWLYSLNGTALYNIVCGRFTVQKTLNLTGLAHLGRGCTLTDNHITIAANNRLENRSNATFHPMINLPNEVSIPEDFPKAQPTAVNILYGNHTQELTKIQERLLNIREHQQLPINLQAHDIHQFGIGYTSLGVVIILGAAVIYLYNRIRQFKWQPSSSSPVGASTISPQPGSSSIFNIELNRFKGGEDVAAATNADR